MRRFLLLLLVLLLPLNAAAAAISALGDAIEHAGQSHHHHHDMGDIDHHDYDADPKGESQAPHAKDHHHAHAAFSSVLPSPLVLNLPPASREQVVAPVTANIAAPPSRLERPPRPYPVA